MKKSEKKFYNERIMNIEHGNFKPFLISEEWLDRHYIKNEVFRYGFLQ